MNEDRFWDLIEGSRLGDARCAHQAARLRRALQALPAEEIAGFHAQFLARRIEAYRWDLWGVAFIVNGGCSDDGFEYFRAWLVAKGRRYFEAALADPIRAADEADVNGDNECEDIMGSAPEAYEAVTGGDLPDLQVAWPSVPSGERWSEDDLDAMYPGLSDRFS